MEVIKSLYDAFMEIKAESSRKAKTEIFQRFLAEAKDAGIEKDVLKVLFMIHSGTVTFGVSDLPEVVVPGQYAMDFDGFVKVMAALAKRSLSGKAAETALIDLVNECSESDISVVRWCLAKETGTGFSVASVNACLERPIPIFEQQKPTSLNSGSDLRQIDWGLLPEDRNFMVEVKYDGNRSYLVCPVEGDAHFLSANGHEVTSMDSLAKHIAKTLGLKGVVLDGELYYKSVEDTGSIVRKKEDQGLSTGITFFCIGALTIDEWRASFTTPLKITNEEMRSRIFDLFRGYMKADLEGAIKLQSHFQMSKCAKVQGKDLEKIKFLMEDAVKQGFEGVVIKDCQATYTRNKECRDGWWKAKFIDEYDAVIVDFQEGTGKNKGKLGAFIVEYKGKRSNVGGSFKDPQTGESSLSDEKRLDYWMERHTLVDKTIRVLSYGLTKDGKFRHASLINFHGEK